MKRKWKVGVVALLIVAVIGILAAKRDKSEPTVPETAFGDAPVTPVARQDPPPPAGQPQVLPRLVDLGSDTCIPCKMMIPVLDQLRNEYAGRLRVEFINVQENPDEGARYGIKLIPTQVFIDATGKELFRHEGFFSKEDIVAKWKELGIDLSAAESSPR